MGSKILCKAHTSVLSYGKILYKVVAMLDNFIIATSATVAVSLGGFALRDVFARAAIKKACRDAAPDIERFKKDNTYVTLLKEKFRAAASVLYETISESREMRRKNIATAKEFVIPNPDLPLELEELQETLMNNQKQFIAIMKNTYVHKARNLFADQIHYKLNYNSINFLKLFLHNFLFLYTVFVQ